MITESFLNSCFTLLLNKTSKVKRTKALYKEILDVLAFSEKKETLDIPITVQSKLDCLKKIAQLYLEDKTTENILDSISFSENFRQHKDFLDVKVNEAIHEHDFQDIIKQIRLRTKINALFENYDDLSKVLESIKDGSFDSIDDLIEDYEITIKRLYSNMMESNRSISIEAAASLDLVKDDYDHVVEMIRKKYDRSNTTPTGFPYIDTRVLNGGYEPSRLYVYGGGSGAGKSTILNNTIYKSALTPLSLESDKKFKQGEISRVYIYVSLENTIEEALMRTYQPLFDKRVIDMLGDIGQKINIKKRITDELAKSGSTIIMKYFPAMSIGALDLMAVLDDAIEEYGKDAIAGLYIDYLDLLKTDTKYDLYRIELGHITLALKTLAVEYNIPVITASQLTRNVYRIDDSHKLSLDMMSESIKKVEHADFVMLLAKDPVDDTVVHGKVGKNRSGKANISLDFKVDFERFKFVSVETKANKQKADDTTNGKSCNKGNTILTIGMDSI
jgi:replicative DNA helicase